MGKIGNRQSTFRNNLYDWFSRFNILLCYFLRNSFPDLNSASDLQKKGNLWCQTSGCVEVSSLLPLCSWLHLGTVHSGIITFLFWLLPPISFPGRKDRYKADYTEAKTFTIDFAKARISPAVLVQCLIPCPCHLAKAPRYAFINWSTPVPWLLAEVI